MAWVSQMIAKQHPKPVIISNSCCVLYRTDGSDLINITTGVPFSYLFIKTTYWALYQKDLGLGII